MTFYDPNGAEWAETLADNWKAVRGEYEALRDELFMESPKGRDVCYEGGWDVFGLCYQGNWIHSHCELVPCLARFLHDVPCLVNAAISILGPESQILPHEEDIPGVLRYDLGLVVPEGCGMRAKDIVCPHVEGGVAMFDPSHEHECWNTHPKITRALLTVDFATPKLEIDRSHPRPLR